MNQRAKWLLTLVASTLMAGQTSVEPVHANDAQRFIGGIVGGFLGQMMRFPRQQYPRYHSNNAGHGNSSGNHSGSDAARDFALASLGANKNLDNVLREVTLKSTEASAGSDDSRKFGRKGDVNDVKVDLPGELERFFEMLPALSDKTTSVGDVTMVTVEAALNEVYEAREQDSLRQFELLPNTTYTSEQFKVDILRASEQKLGKFTKGNNRNLVLIGQIKQLFMEAARDVYNRTFEVAELTAMNLRVMDFDRDLYENGKGLAPGTVAATGGQPPASSDASDDDADEATQSSSAQAMYKTASVPQSPQPVSKMRHITSEMLRLARQMADDIPFEQTRETRDFGAAYRYRLTRATIDCFIEIATATGPATPASAASPQASSADPTARGALSPQVATVESEDDRYEDLVRKFQVSISKAGSAEAIVDPSSDKTAGDTDGQCRQRVYKLAGLGNGAGQRQGSNTGAARDLGGLRQPQSEAAVWNGSAWTVADSTAQRQ